MMIVGAMLLLRPTASAQVGSIEQVVVLPVSVPDGRNDLSDRLTDELRSGVRHSAFQRLSTPEEVAQQLDGRSAGSVMKSVSKLLEFSEFRGTAFIIAGVASVLDDGSIEVSILLFSRSEKAIHAIKSASFSDEDEAVTGIRTLAFELTHPKNFAPVDTAFFYSLIIPGMGQLNQGEPLHAAVSAGFVLAAILYGVATPSHNSFNLDWASYRADPIYGTDQYRFTIHDTDVSEEEFYRRLSADRQRNTRAYLQRIEVKQRRKRANIFLAGAYLFNLVDTMILTRRELDTGPFFMRLEAVSDPALPYTDPRFQVRVGIRFR
ncbi:hypothetical protein ACFL3H_00835 [Gemmatimonadota bacterium]